MLLSDYVIDFLARKDIRDVFLVSGGGIMYLLDSVGRSKDVRYYCSYHEQAAAGRVEVDAAHSRLRARRLLKGWVEAGLSPVPHCPRHGLFPFLPRSSSMGMKKVGTHRRST